MWSRLMPCFWNEIVLRQLDSQQEGAIEEKKTSS